MLRKDARIALLRNVPLFAGCSKRELREIASVADEIDFPEGKTLAREGAAGREFFVLVDGDAQVTSDGRTLAQLGAGSWFGEMALLTSEPRTATVVTTSPVRTLVIADREFRALMERHPQIAGKVLTSVAQRLARNAQS
jgi:CRP/FNR family transcriptional regulator, cyclic AMP receptor protein